MLNPSPITTINNLKVPDGKVLEDYDYIKMGIESADLGSVVLVIKSMTISDILEVYRLGREILFEDNLSWSTQNGIRLQIHNPILIKVVDETTLNIRSYTGTYPNKIHYIGLCKLVSKNKTFKRVK